MRFKSKTTHGFTVFAVTGINTISFAIANYIAYWNLLKDNPGGLATDTDEVKKKKLKELQLAVEKIQRPIKPTEIDKIPTGVTTLFSPMTDLTTLKLYAELLDRAKQFACITFPFGNGLNIFILKNFLRPVRVRQDLNLSYP